jgi:hypothetical protein
VGGLPPAFIKPFEKPNFRDFSRQIEIPHHVFISLNVAVKKFNEHEKFLKNFFSCSKKAHFSCQICDNSCEPDIRFQPQPDTKFRKGN